MEGVRASLVRDAFEGAPVPLKHADDPGMGPCGNLFDVPARGEAEGVERQASLGVADVDAVARALVG